MAISTHLPRLASCLLRTLVVGSVLVGLSACVPKSKGNDTKGDENPQGTKHSHTLKVDNLSREFIVYVPPTAASIKAPVVFMLHGTGGDGEQFYNISYWRQKAAAEGLIAVFPTALNHCLYEDENKNGIFEEPTPPNAEGPGYEKKVITKWAMGKLGTADMPLCTDTQINALPEVKQALVDHPLADDMAFFDGMLDFLAANYAIDSKRIYVTGFSNGGQMAARLAAERSERFAAAASHAGSLTVGTLATRPISMVFSFGSKDDRLLPDDGSITELPMVESLAQDPLYQSLVSPYLASLQLTNTYTYEKRWGECDETTGICLVHTHESACVVKANCAKVIKFSYASSTIGATNRLHVLLVDENTHQYPNGGEHPLIMATYLWDEFFINHSLP